MIQTRTELVAAPTAAAFVVHPAGLTSIILFARESEPADVCCRWSRIERREHTMTKSPAPNEKIPRLKVRPIQKSSISDKIVQQIMTLISNGDLKAGQRLPSERELCKKFAAGRSSLREALRCLSIMGVLTAKVGDG